MQMIFRVYPPGWSGDTIGELNKLLESGYKVISTTTINNGKQNFTDYLIEKKEKEKKYNSVGQ